MAGITSPVLINTWLKMHMYPNDMYLLVCNGSWSLVSWPVLLRTMQNEYLPASQGPALPFLALVERACLNMVHASRHQASISQSIWCLGIRASDQ